MKGLSARNRPTSDASAQSAFLRAAGSPPAASFTHFIANGPISASRTLYTSPSAPEASQFCTTILLSRPASSPGAKALGASSADSPSSSPAPVATLDPATDASDRSSDAVASSDAGASAVTPSASSSSSSSSIAASAGGSTAPPPASSCSAKDGCVPRGGVAAGASASRRWTASRSSALVMRAIASSEPSASPRSTSTARSASRAFKSPATSRRSDAWPGPPSAADARAATSASSKEPHTSPDRLRAAARRRRASSARGWSGPKAPS